LRHSPLSAGANCLCTNRIQVVGNDLLWVHDRFSSERLKGHKTKEESNRERYSHYEFHHYPRGCMNLNNVVIRCNRIFATGNGFYHQIF
jgi:hypothetical protein